MDLNQIGPFSQLFDSHGYYLDLLILGNAKTSIITVQKAVKESTNLEKEISVLLNDIDWRPHLVAGVALLMVPSRNLSDLLWHAIDRGSWVIPQLAVTAYFHDPHFSQHAKQRLEKRYPVEFYPPILTIFPLFHSITGGSSNYQLSCKSVSSLVALCETIPELVLYTSKLAKKDDIKKLVDNDKDNSGKIAIEWLRKISAYFVELGITLIRSEDKPS